MTRYGALRRGLLPAAFPLMVFFLFCAGLAEAKPVTFEFKPPADARIKNPFARELWAEVTEPSGQVIVLPAFYSGNGVFAVNARPSAVGKYRIGDVAETTAGTNLAKLTVEYVSEKEVEVKATTRLPYIVRHPRIPTAFARSDGRPFIPTGANLAWPEGPSDPFYRRAFVAFAGANLNWARVWMVHWGALNLDWVPDWLGASPPPGGIDQRVAANWDNLLESAEESGVYVQMVFQYHGQFTTGANSAWKENPWNAANPGGFLKTPTEFFTSPTARLMTMMKYRYIAARWGWSPAVFAWELFNEVHWVDAIDKEKNEAVVATWHASMADWLRAIDPYHHLITTSTDNLRSPCYEKMDFYQPHLYAADLLLGVRALPSLATDRPVFYGEIGDDHLDVSTAAKKSGVAIVPPSWAGLLGQAAIPAQPWVGATILEQGRVSELGAVSRFALLSKLAAQSDLVPVTASVETATRVPLEIHGCQVWQRRAAPEIDMPLDGSLPLALADVPRIYVGWPTSVADGFPDRATYHFNLPRATTFRARLVDSGQAAAGMRFIIDGTVAAEKSWPADSADRPRAGHPVEVTFSMPQGRHTLVVQNAGNGDWVDLAGLDLGFDASVLASIGRRNQNFIALWVWNRSGVFAVDSPSPVTGIIVLDDVPEGKWTVRWWDTLKGAPAGAPLTIVHPGGALRLPTPPIARHAAVVLSR